MRILAPENKNRLYFALIFILFLSVASFVLVFTKSTQDYISNIEKQTNYIEVSTERGENIDEKI
ncbi:MAG: hypothetical protein R3346_02260 [Candidatus Spechtbacterales bacterium]|nr:hypothetical protein [Candidatus Spechtbacterales bacterium]